MFRWYRRFKRKHRTLHILIAAVAIVMLWRAVWGLLDTYLFPENYTVSLIVGGVIALAILFFDDFHLKELE